MRCSDPRSVDEVPCSASAHGCSARSARGVAGGSVGAVRGGVLRRDELRHAHRPRALDQVAHLLQVDLGRAAHAASESACRIRPAVRTCRAPRPPAPAATPSGSRSPSSSRPWRRRGRRCCRSGTSSGRGRRLRCFAATSGRARRPARPSPAPRGKDTSAAAADFVRSDFVLSQHEVQRSERHNHVCVESTQATRRSRGQCSRVTAERKG